MTVSVLIPTYRRPDDLIRCLQAVRDQVQPADEVLVVARPDDSETSHALSVVDLPRLRVVHAGQPGQVAALRAGVAAAACDVVAITDDDAAPRPDWVRRIRDHFESDPRLGGLGGRDWVHGPEETVNSGEAVVVGRVQWFGRPIGNHHLGAGAAREVDMIKGANMSYRREALLAVNFDLRLRGAGAQIGNDMAVSLGVKRAGWRIVYDPAVAVDHYPATRHDEDDRCQPSPLAIADVSFNESIVLMEHQRARFGVVGALVYLLYAVLVGTRALPGGLQVARSWVVDRSQPAATSRLRPSLQGRVDAVLHLLRHGSSVPPVALSASPLA